MKRILVFNGRIDNYTGQKPTSVDTKMIVGKEREKAQAGMVKHEKLDGGMKYSGGGWDGSCRYLALSGCISAPVCAAH